MNKAQIIDVAQTIKRVNVTNKEFIEVRLGNLIYTVIDRKYIHAQNKGGDYIIFTDLVELPPIRDIFIRNTFRVVVGREPIEDDMAMVTCSEVGKQGHEMCGFCLTHSQPCYTHRCDDPLRIYPLHFQLTIMSSINAIQKSLSERGMKV